MSDDFDAFYDQVRPFEDALISDLSEASRFLAREDTQFTRRVYCRALMALFEGVVHNFRSYTITFHSPFLGKDEIAALEKRAGALESAFHSFDLYTNVAGASTPLERDSERWLILKKAIRIRNRITHPKSLEDLEISTLDMVHLKVTAKTVFDLVSQCLKETGAAFLEQLKALEEAEERYFGSNVTHQKNTAEQAGAANPHAFGTFGTSAAEQPLAPKASGDT